MQIRSGAEERTLDSIRASLAETEKTLKQLVIETASGKNTGAPEGDEKAWKSQSRDWFKSGLGGTELAEKAITLGGWNDLSPRLLPLVTAILGTLGLAVTDSFPND